MSNSGQINSNLITFQNLIRNLNESLIAKKSNEYSIETEFNRAQIQENPSVEKIHTLKPGFIPYNPEINNFLNRPVLNNQNPNVVKNAFKKKLLSKINEKEINLNILQ
jgi:hypothetical protein